MGLSTGRREAEGGAIRDINVTPMVDVMLVLLIVFMVAAPLLATGLNVKLPEVQATNTAVKDAKLVLTVTKDEKFVLGETDVTLNLEEVLQTNPRLQQERELYIRGDRDARYGAVARAVAAARVAGVSSLNLMVDPQAEIPK
jgi:biopolymer transport protein TolR